MSTVLGSREALLRPIVFTRPLRLTEPTSWVPHIPFAFWLIDAARPTTVVELGTMSGNSYSAIAQGIQVLGLEAACYAIDTWKGDPQAGFYAEDVFLEWSAFHDQHFGAFSRLVRSTFDEAVEKFHDGTIDLLHVDGFHTYEAVAHDFQSWLPKLSPRAVVLLHDINVRVGDFGVWRFWQEVTEAYPGFAFLHGHGLGVVGVGQDLPADIRLLLEDVSRDAREVFITREFFGTLGEALLRQPREAQLVRREQELVAQLSQAQHELARVGAENHEAQQEASRLREMGGEMGRELTHALADAEASRIQLRAAVDERDSAREREAGYAGDLRKVRTEFETQARRYQASLGTVGEEASAYLRLLLRITRSRSWKATSPLRKSAAVTRELGRRVLGRSRPGNVPSALASARPANIRQVRLIRRNGLFDELYYLRDLGRLLPDGALAAALADPIIHYLAVGASLGADPHPLFDTSFYLERNPDVAASGVNPLTHFLRSGGFERRDPHPLFDSGFYLTENPQVAVEKLNPLVHFLLYGAREGRDPNPWFDTSFYVAADPGFRFSVENPLAHYLRVGATEGRPTGPAFDTAYYLSANPDVAASGVNPLVHFVLVGLVKGYRASAAATLPSIGDVTASCEAYESLRAQARQEEERRKRAFVPVRPALIDVADDDLRAAAARVAFRAGTPPEVSVVIPVLNGLRRTLECLICLTHHDAGVPFEVIVVDNGSTDQSRELLSAIPHLRYIRHDSNLGFGAACNAGADDARGRFVAFLNNDTQPQPGWLSALLSTFTDFDHVGGAGPKVLFPDGRLQDAGSAINPDCTSSLIGVFDDPRLPRFNTTREVDYLSGVCLLMETRLFRELGGFDRDFAPAYCEDVDLCLRVRREGLRLVYQPSAVIVHHLSATANEQGPSFKATLVARHQQKLSLKHQAAIEELNQCRIVAFYLPQFHPIPENDVWWGKGFTEWRNVARARPNFEGHYQPRLPGDLGFYDLRVRDIYLEQVALAERYGVSGFCFYYYWFNGKRLLERPLERLMEDDAMSFPFCVCWANENWTRRWDGLEHEILMSQSHREEDEVAVIEDLMRYMRHRTYIRIDGRPLLLVYNATRFPDMRRTLETWRCECRRHGLGEVYLAMVESFELSRGCTSPLDWGFDAAVEFPPHEGGLYPVEPGHLLNEKFAGRVFDYNKTALHYMTRAVPGYRRFRTVMPGWDNTARRQDDPAIFVASTPGGYQAWLEAVLRQTREQHFGDERLVFINAWNEWAEAAYLEPDSGWGHAYLEATKNARDNLLLNLRAH
jgi:GT2 family glycosyltransferase